MGVGVCTEQPQSTPTNNPTTNTATNTTTTPSDTQPRERPGGGEGHVEREEGTQTLLGPNHAGLVTYSVIEAGERAVVGPRIGLLNICGCDGVRKEDEEEEDAGTGSGSYEDSHHHGIYQHLPEPDPQHSFSAPPGVQHSTKHHYLATSRHHHLHHYHHFHHTCTPHTCLNGGRCVPGQSGFR